MNDPQTTIPTVDAGKALADIGGAAPRVTPMAAPASAGHRVDNLGQPFDSMRHAVDKAGNPILHASGRWALKRGNGSLKAQGKPMVGLIMPPKAKPEGASAETQPAGAATSEGPTPGQVGVVDATTAPPPVFVETDYEGTAAGVTAGMFGILALIFGPAWDADTAERDTWRGALRRLWFHYQLPRIGPIVEVLMLIPVTIAKRRNDAKTLEGWAKVKVWCGFKAKPDDQNGEKRVA